jgi:hypothetical protein
VESVRLTGVSGTFSYSMVDGGHRTPQTGTLNTSQTISLNGYAVMLLQQEDYVPPPPPVPDPTQQTYTITTSAGAGGQVSPAGLQPPQVVGITFYCVASAAQDKKFRRWLLNGAVQSTQSTTFAFSQGMANGVYTLKAEFEDNLPVTPPIPDPDPDPLKFTVNIGSDVGCTTDLLGVQTLLAGQTLTVHVTSVKPNHRFIYWLLDGVESTHSKTFTLDGVANTTYTLRPVTQYVEPPPPSKFVLPSGDNIGVMSDPYLDKITAKLKKQKPIDLDELFKKTG